MRITAYVLAGDPAWAAESLSSYYCLVDRVIVSFDDRFLSWSGSPMPTQRAIDELRSADPDNKLVLAPGSFAAPEQPTLVTETQQRQAALDAASAGADWVLQVDTDEVLLSPEAFLAFLQRADELSCDALDFPLRDFYQRIGTHTYLEHCGRLWGPQAAYPGPLAVRAHTQLAHCRQVLAPTYRVDFSWHNTDPAHGRNAPVHAMVEPDQAVAHMSWVREPEEMALKADTSGYAGARDWQRDLSRWEHRGRHPVREMLLAPLKRDRYDRFRIARIPVARGRA